MYQEVIRSTPFWLKGDIPGPRWDCVFIDVGNLEDIGMKGPLVARVYLFFKFSYEGVDYSCALSRMRMVSVNYLPEYAYF